MVKMLLFFSPHESDQAISLPSFKSFLVRKAFKKDKLLSAPFTPSFSVQVNINPFSSILPSTFQTMKKGRDCKVKPVAIKMRLTAVDNFAQDMVCCRSKHKKIVPSLFFASFQSAFISMFACLTSS